MLTADQAGFFARNGYLQIADAVPPATCAALVERTWTMLPRHWRRDAPSSWRGPVTDSCHTVGLDRGGLLKFQQKDIGRDPMVVAAYQPSSPLHELARAMIGRPLRQIRVRGLYAIAPAERPDLLPAAPSPHVEAHPSQIVALTYLDDVAQGGGGLLVWPGSHREFYRAFTSKLEYSAGPDLAACLARNAARTPRELHGRRGDIVLMHHRLLHSPSVNRRDRIRFAFLCDYTPVDEQALCEQPPGDLWEDWPGLVQLAGPGGLDGEAERVPAAAAPTVPRRRWWAFRWPTRVHHSSRNKHDASLLVRQRQPGAVWLALSDSRAWFDSNEKLGPKGGPLTERGVTVTLNGAPLASRSRGDFTTPLPVRDGTNVLVIRGICSPLWLRVLAFRLPFTASEVLLRTQIAGDRREAEVQFTWTPATVPGVAV